MTHKIKQTIQRFLIGLLTALTLFMPSSSVLADNTPRFNSIQGDQEFLTGRNITKGQNVYTDPITAQANDVVRVRIFYHNDAVLPNGDNGEAARNTTIKLNIPTEDAVSHLITGSISADNAATVTGTVVDGQEVGRHGLTINSDTTTRLSLIPGSVKWYPNRSNTAQALPSGQSGDEIITSGIKIGDIKGCWQFSGFVTVDVKLSGAGFPNLIRSKSAVNQTQGNVPAQSVKAKPGDVIIYQLQVENTGNETQSGFIIADDISDILDYASVVSISDGGAVVTVGNGAQSIAAIVYPAVNIAAGQKITRTFTVAIKDEATWPANGDLIMTNIYGNRLDVPINPPKKTPGLTIEKHVKNITQSFDFRDEVQAATDDLLEYRIRVKNIGDDFARNVIIKDQLSSGLDYQAGTATLSRGGSTVGINDDIISGNGYHLPSPLAVGEEITITYRVKVGTAANACNRLRNIATVVGDNISEVFEDAFVNMPCTFPAPQPQPGPEPTPQPQPGPFPGPTELPRSGPADIGFTLLAVTSSGATSWRYLLAKRALKRAARSIVVL